MTLLHLEIAHKVQWLCCSVLYIMFYDIFLLVFCVVCKLCKSFDKKKQKPPMPLLFTDNIKLERIPTKLNKKYMPFLHCV